jgi:hypothetical protein
MCRLTQGNYRCSALVQGWIFCAHFRKHGLDFNGVMAQQVIHTALIWLLFPTAVIGSFKARLCTLITKQERRDASGLTED